MNYQEIQKVLGTDTNDDAAAGYVGEFQTATLAAASATSLTSGAAKTITSMSLTAGDWDVYGLILYLPAATTSITKLVANITLVSDTSGGEYLTQLSYAGEVSGGLPFGVPTPVYRYSFASTTTVYLIANQTFTVSTMTGAGTINARRAR